MPGVKDYVLNSGLARGVRCLDIDCGALEFTLVADRCLDIHSVKYSGKQLAFLSKNGIVAPQYYDPAGNGWLKSFPGGLVVTCGLQNAGEPCELDGWRHGLHGRVSHLPAENVCVQRAGDDITVRGTVRETSLMGGAYELRREVSAPAGGNTLRLSDTITNHADMPIPLMLLYHLNFGGDLLRPGTRVSVPGSVGITPFDEHARAHLGCWDEIGEPAPGAPEQVFLHQVRPCPQGWGEFALEGAEVAVHGRYTAKELPYLGLWKCQRPGEYAVALEPCNSHLRGVRHERDNGTLRMLAPGEEASTRLEFRFSPAAGAGL